MRLVGLLLVVLAALAVAACGSDGGGGAGGGEAPAAQTLQVSATDFAFEPADLTADAGEIAIELANDGESPHAIEVEGHGVEQESETIDAGETTTLTLDLDDGQYEIYCPVGDHADRGMVGTLTVGSGAGGGGATTEDTHTDETETGETETDDGETGETETDDGETGETDTGSAGAGY